MSNELHERLVEMVDHLESEDGTVAKNLELYAAGEDEDADGNDIHDQLEAYGVRTQVQHTFVLAGGGPSMELIVTMSAYDKTEIDAVEVLATWWGNEPVRREYWPDSVVWRYAEYLTQGYGWDD